MRKVLALLFVGLAAEAQAPKNADLEKAQKALAAKKYADALKSLEAAEKKGGLDLDSFSTLLESKALCEASTQKLDKAQESFRRLLVIDPRRDMAGKYKGDVVKALDAALESVKKSGGIQVVALEPVAEKGRITRVSLQVKNDPLAMVKAVRIHVKQADGAWKPTDAALANAVATADTDAENVEFWAELLDGSKDQVFFLGSAVRPVKQSAPPAPVVAEAPKPEPKKVEEAPPPVKKVEVAPAPAPAPKAAEAELTDEKKQPSMLRPVSYALLGVGIIAAAVGVYFGASSAGARSSIAADYATMMFSQQALYDRDQAAIGQAKIANALFISAAVVAAVGIVMFILGG